MGKTEVKKEHFYQVPVLLIVEIVDKEYFKFLYLFQPLTQLYNNEQAKVDGDFKVGKEIQNQDKHTNEIDRKVILQVIPPNIP